jgi:hypothetical protein
VIVPVLGVRVDDDALVASRDRLYPVGTLVVAVRLCEPDTRAPLTVGVRFIARLLTEAFNVIDIDPTRLSPVTALVPWGWMIRLPATKDRRKQLRKMPVAMMVWLNTEEFKLGNPDFVRLEKPRLLSLKPFPFLSICL